MDYPWWTIEAAKFGFQEEDEIRCLTCAESGEQILGGELTDFEINQLGGVSCRSCGRRWPPLHIEGLRCFCPGCTVSNTLASRP